ncbi:hypothetical protein TanjilG_16063 [Lupinus angustifolius]|uniref:Xyloglucan endotransglucosylase/hydrolase n=1 Tax=Lupinus angustifolius TaxID=3871 RepID=A0A4P1RHR8_LUPAN|nr:PREDICTED: probable xyloglucan endotransglucosylase/hydrolase protein 30 [Lupinus angustifolius]OIW10691.1 hypothetical protein TanjilG_16063 [Lupinus angustifolius]
MDHNLRCFGTTPKTHNLFSLIFFFFFFSFSNAAFDLATIPFSDGYSLLFGGSNVVRTADDNGVKLLLDRYTGSGFISSNMYRYGFFSANIKLPSNYTAGVCVAFYTSNGDVFQKSHDELDFEFLGNVAGKPWQFQTNLYGNGSTNRGREERYRLWFDPTKEYHRYSILWTAKNVIFYIDDVPIREVLRSVEMGGDYPSKPMSLYATIWDASNWATSGGRYKANYKYAPFIAEFKDLVLKGCPVNPIQEVSDDKACADQHIDLEAQEYATMTPMRRRAMHKFRKHFMYYSYCYDTLRYPTLMPECNIIPAEQERFMETGRLRSSGSRRRQARRKSRTKTLVDVTNKGYM